jgi:hypothetical protein
MNMSMKRCLVVLLSLSSSLMGCMLDIQEPTSSKRVNPADSTTNTNTTDGGRTNRLNDASNDADVESDIAFNQDTGVIVNLDNSVPIEDMGIVVDAMTEPEIPFFDTAWSHRAKILITPPVIAEAVEQVPVYVRISLTELAASEALQVDGDDIRFVDATGEVIAHTFVGCGLIDNTLAMVVKVPLIVPGNVNQFIWMYYGNNDAIANQFGVWDETDLTMMHMCGARQNADEVADDTGSGNDGIALISQRVRQSDGWGKALDLSGSIGTGLNVPSLSGSEFRFNAFTLSFSVSMNWQDKVSVLLGSTDDSEGPQYRLKTLSEGLCQFEGVGGTGDPDPVPVPCITNGTSSHYTLLEGFGGTILVIDGVDHFVDLPELVVSPSPGFQPTGQIMTFLAGVEGRLDEVQLSSVRHSVSWAQVRQASLMNTLLTVDY